MKESKNENPGFNALFGHISKELQSSLHVIITWACNYRCKFCFELRHPKKFMWLWTLKRIIKNNPDKKLYLTGGEPLLHPKIIKILDLILAAGKDGYIITNGSLLEKYKKDIEKLCNKYPERTIMIKHSTNNEIRRQNGDLYNHLFRVKQWVDSGPKNLLLELHHIDFEMQECSKANLIANGFNEKEFKIMRMLTPIKSHSESFTYAQADFMVQGHEKCTSLRLGKPCKFFEFLQLINGKKFDKSKEMQKLVENILSYGK
jgi:organic radical activating enzyme